MTVNLIFRLNASPQLAVRDERNFIGVDLRLIPLFFDIASMYVLKHIFIDHILNINDLFQ